MVQAYLLLQGSLYTSTSQPEMQTTSFLRIPRTHIMMSLASFASETTVQAVPLADGSQVKFLSLGPRVSELMNRFTS